jgi:hypothetical protein
LGLVVYVIVRVGLFLAKCHGLSAIKMLLIPAIFMSVAFVLTTTPVTPILMSMMPSLRDPQPFSFVTIGVPTVLLLATIFATAYVVGRTGRGGAVVA